MRDSGSFATFAAIRIGQPPGGRSPAGFLLLECSLNCRPR
jgi:hypothetical protein